MKSREDETGFRANTRIVEADASHANSESRVKAGSQENHESREASGSVNQEEIVNQEANGSPEANGNTGENAPQDTFGSRASEDSKSSTSRQPVREPSPNVPPDSISGGANLRDLPATR